MSSPKSIHDVLLNHFVAPTKRPLDSVDNEDQVSLPDKVSKVETPEQAQISLKDLQFSRILNISPKAKRVCMECQYEGSPALVIIEKTSFEAEIPELVISNFAYD